MIMSNDNSIKETENKFRIKLQEYIMDRLIIRSEFKVKVIPCYFSLGFVCHPFVHITFISLS